ncbi:MAG TPA: glycosyltransferase family 2 protein [Thermoanaerobaculia bacterium]
MRLLIQIPAWNEEASLPSTIAALPRRLPPFSDVTVLVVDDGSTDRTADAAISSGARLIRLPSHFGLAAAFRAGLDAALDVGADVIVNLDADGQYDPADIPALVAPILSGQADLVVGDRGPGTLAHFSPGKRLLQRLGSWVVAQASGLKVPDATSGFRALSREAARRINVFSRMTYTLETLIQAGSKGLRVVSVPVRARPTARKSRLLSSIPHYVLVQGANILRITALYKPLKVFSAAAALFLFGGFGLGLRFLYYYFFTEQAAGHVQSLILAAVLLLAGVLTFLLALLADLVSVNRRLLEELRLRDPRRDPPDRADARTPDAQTTHTSDR